MTKDEAHHSCRNDFERLLLWGQGLSVVDGDLDDVLIHAQELHDQVLTLLLRLGTAVLQGLSRDPSVLSQVMMEQCDDLRSLLETTEAMLREPESDEPARPYTPAGSDASEYGTTEVAEEITIYTDCLLDLSPALDNPALDINVGGSGEPPGQAKESFTVSSDEALIYCRRIRDRFEPLPKYLVERLAKANVNRATVLRDRRSRSAKPGILVTDDITESLFSSADYRLTDTTKSTAPSSSVFSSIAQPKATAREILGFNDNSSDATFASFSTTASAIGLGRPRVPPLPAMSGDGFDCPICSLHTIGVRNRKDWK
ncbi:hypothetical protein B0H66DRAFT_530078 [Apodospora peruviana]|uniref:Uncharacterized protein n=1 Tax=Apodospora peruviana TaxID=516989 RepID=A0AAE0MBX8_9PEZI|nr:hypothetical protein B0H66DRAFT_530078 [Apodospora peruviana]